MICNVLALMGRIETRRQKVRIVIAKSLKELIAIWIGEFREPDRVGALSFDVCSIVRREAEVAKHVIEGAVLHQDDHYGFDIVETGHEMSPVESKCTARGRIKMYHPGRLDLVFQGRVFKFCFGFSLVKLGVRLGG